MNFKSLLVPTTVRRTLLAVAAGAACSGALAVDLPDFTLNPAAVGLAGTAFTADNIIISDYSTVRFTTPTTFSDSGFLSVASFQLDSQAITPVGLNSTYGLYFQFSGNGTTTAGDPSSVATSGQFNSLNFSLFGYNGPPATFGFDGSNNATVSGVVGGTTLLATGSLLPGANQSSVGTLPQSPSFTAFAGANLSFVIDPAAAGFFASPNPFYNVAISSFINSPSQVSAIANGFTITNGGGSVNFAQPIPEPETYALFLAGLGALGWVARRRRVQ